MEIICLLLCVLSSSTARVYPRAGINDVFDGVEGVIYDIPDYEDPEVSLFRLIAKGIMPVYMTRDTNKDSKGPTSKDDKPHYETDDIKRGLDAVIAQLQEAKNKLENGNNGIYLDIDKSVLYLENLKHQLYLDLHDDDAYGEHPTKSDKGSTDKYLILKDAIKKYLSSDDLIYKHFPFDVPDKKPLTSDISADLAFSFDTGLVPFSAPNASVDDQSSAQNFSAKTFFVSNSSADKNLPSGNEQHLVFDAVTEQPAIFDKDVFKYQFLRTEGPHVEVIPDEKKSKTSMLDDVASAETDKVKQENKTLIRKQWSWKLSSIV